MSIDGTVVKLKASKSTDRKLNPPEQKNNINDAKCSTLWGAANAQFTSPARHDKRVLSVSCLAWRCELALTDQIVSWCRQCRPIGVWKFRDRCVDDEARLENTTFRVGLNGSCCCCRWISRSKAVFKAHVTVRNITIDAILKQFHSRLTRSLWQRQINLTFRRHAV